MAKADREMTGEEHDAYGRLKSWKRRFDAILGLYERDSVTAFMPSIHVDRARALYVKLKADLKAERHRLEYDEDVTAAEKRWLDRPIRHAKAHLLAPTNWRPDKWHFDLHNSRDDIDIVVYKMRDYFDLAKE